MSVLEGKLKARIGAAGPIPFSEFMETALYDPGHGYYLRARDPFGREGDFFTAAQLQPVFGRLVARAVARLRDEMGAPEDFRVWDLGAGRGEMAEALASFPYLGVDVARGEWPRRFTGVVFANELFDALPVDVARRAAGGFVEMRVNFAQGRFTWVRGAELQGDDLDYARRNAPAEDGAWLEIPRGAYAMIDRLAAALARGFVLIVDYGYTRPERVRFPRGSLLSYRRHQALDDVLAEPGGRDITAHVPFDALDDRAGGRGLRRVRLETLAEFLLRAGESDQFAAALRAETEEESRRLRLQLKTLLVGMGETFRCLLWRKDERA